MGKSFEEKTMIFYILAKPETEKLWVKRLAELDHRTISPDLTHYPTPLKTQHVQLMVDDLRVVDVVLIETTHDHSPNLIREVLFGVAVGFGKPIYIIGPQQHLFCHLPGLILCESFEHFLYKQQTG